MFTNANKFNSQLLDRIGGTLRGGTWYVYQTTLDLDHILSRPDFFASSNGNFGSGDMLTIMRYEGPGPLPVNKHELKEKVDCIVVRAGRDGVHLLPHKYFDVVKAWEAYQAKMQPAPKPMTVEWNVGRRGYDVVQDSKVIAKFGKDEKETAEAVAVGKMPVPELA